MEKRRKPHPGWDCGWKWPCATGCRDLGYIVERIVSNRHCNTCFDGVITPSGFPAHLKPPLTLCRIEVMQVKPVCPTEPSIGCGTMGRVCLVLLCCVVDRCGCRGEGVVQIEVEDCCRPERAWEAGTNVRRGAQVEISNACFCAPCSFHVCLNICLHTVVSCCEMVGARPQPCNSCPTLPLYPPPCPHCSC